jgi:hypothetical protein
MGLQGFTFLPIIFLLGKLSLANNRLSHGTSSSLSWNMHHIFLPLTDGISSILYSASFLRLIFHIPNLHLLTGSFSFFLFFTYYGVHTGSTRHVSHWMAYCTCPGWLWWWSNWWNGDWQGKPKYLEQTCPSATLSTTNLNWPDPGLNPGRSREKPATNRLSYGAASPVPFETSCKFFPALHKFDTMI